MALKEEFYEAKTILTTNCTIGWVVQALNDYGNVYKEHLEFAKR
jgi:hypothetical protein